MIKKLVALFMRFFVKLYFNCVEDLYEFMGFDEDKDKED